MPKVLITEKFGESGLERLKKEADVDLLVGLSKEELIRRIGDYDALIVRSATKVTKDVIDAGRNLKVIARAGVGVDNIDVDAATNRGIVVVNAPGGSTVSVAEHTMALILGLCRKIHQAHQSLKSGKWERGKFMGTQLRGKTLGIIGLGRIGGEVARRASAFGMRVIAYDPYISVDRAREVGATLVDLDELLRSSDIITIHTPLTDETKRLVGRKEIEKMKDGVMIINCARGGIVDEEALADAIKSGKVAGAALDVYEKEPPTGSPLLELDNVLLTPHVAASTAEAQEEISITIAEDVMNCLKGMPVQNAVNMITLKPEQFELIKPYIYLGEKLGKLAAQLVDGGIKEVIVSYHGEIAERETEIVTTAVLKGMLEGKVSNVTYVNSMLLARERGINVRSVKGWAVENFSSLISVEVRTTKEKRTICGTVFGTDDARIVKVDEYRINAVPSGYMIFSRHIDKPKVIGPVGMIFGEAGINIAGMQVGRIKPGEEALMVLNIDAKPSEDLIRRMREVDGIIDAKLVEL